MITTIGFDADDTLWDYEHIYHDAKPKIAEILGDGYDYKELFYQLDQAEVRNISLYGYGIKSFALSMLEKVVQHSHPVIETEKILRLIDLIRDMLQTTFQVHPAAQKTLEFLSQRFELILITKGETYEQGRKIERSGLAKYFSAVEIVGFKTQETYRQLLDKHGVNPKNFLMVGNSLKSDVLPVVKIGGQAVHIPHEVAWFHEEINSDEQEEIDYYQLENLEQLVDHINHLTAHQ